MRCFQWPTAARAFAAVLLLALPQWAAADEAETEGRALAQELLHQRPEVASTNRATLRVRDRSGQLRTLPLTVVMGTSPAAWRSTYTAGPETNFFQLEILHEGSAPPAYILIEPGPGSPRTNRPAGNGTMIPFAGSDFWVADLGLEFLRWPAQKIVEREMRRSRFSLVLESTNPDPAPGAYSRVRSWIDKEKRGIVIAEAYGADGRLLKVFTPRDPTKVGDRYEVGELELRNVREKTQTTIEFRFAE